MHGMHLIEAKICQNASNEFATPLNVRHCDDSSEIIIGFLLNRLIDRNRIE